MNFVRSSGSWNRFRLSLRSRRALWSPVSVLSVIGPTRSLLSVVCTCLYLTSLYFCAALTTSASVGDGVLVRTTSAAPPRRRRAAADGTARRIRSLHFGEA